ncbi:MAG TPA: hypothetical protein VKN82_04380, partial [Desulfohalobiaceae bacterium]|nr:hypothetical protein [Desulfohalobiaceae bacterium]
FKLKVKTSIYEQSQADSDHWCLIIRTCMIKGNFLLDPFSKRFISGHGKETRSIPFFIAGYGQKYKTAI